MNEPVYSILVVDDDVDTCRNLSDILTDMGYEVDMAHDGPSALAILRRRRYDVALLDFKMPGMDGLTLYREIRKLRAGTVAMIVSAYATADTVDEAINAGAWQVISKPVDFSRLLPLVEEATQQPLVLVVDDDRDLCGSLWDVLRERDFRVCLAHNEEEAAERISEQDYRVVLIDLKLPQGSGQGVFQRVRQRMPEARTVLVTGYRSEMEQLVEQARTEGADAVCYKPFDVSHLIQTIQNLATRQSR